jgi:hypothetical protein
MHFLGRTISETILLKRTIKRTGKATTAPWEVVRRRVMT